MRPAGRPRCTWREGWRCPSWCFLLGRSQDARVGTCPHERDFAALELPHVLEVLTDVLAHDEQLSAALERYEKARHRPGVQPLAHGPGRVTAVLRAAGQ